MTVAAEAPELCLREPHNRCAYVSGDGQDGCQMQCALRHPAELPKDDR